MADEGREATPSNQLREGSLWRKEMDTLETRESTIRIPAEYIRRGRRLEDHIDELAHDASSVDLMKMRTLPC